MEFSRSRPRLAPDLDGLLKSQLSIAIDEADIGLSDRGIARMYYIDHIPQEDIAAELMCDRSTVSRRLKAIAPRVSTAAQKLNLPQ